MSTITMTYIDGTIDEFKSSNHIFTDDDDDDWIIIKENPKDSEDDDYDEEDDEIIAEIRKDQIRKIQYD